MHGPGSTRCRSPSLRYLIAATRRRESRPIRVTIPFAGEGQQIRPRPPNARTGRTKPLKRKTRPGVPARALRNCKPFNPSAFPSRARIQDARRSQGSEMNGCAALDSCAGTPCKTPFVLTRGKCRFQKVFTEPRQEAVREAEGNLDKRRSRRGKPKEKGRMPPRWAANRLWPWLAGCLKIAVIDSFDDGYTPVFGFSSLFSS